MKNHLLCLLLMASATPVSAQTCNTAIQPTTPINRFLTSPSTGVTIDKQTGLMWMRCTLGQTWNGASCQGGAALYTWQQALAAAESSEFAGFTDWRLPNVKELVSIIEQACYEPQINTAIFSQPPHSYYGWLSSWSSTSFSFDANKALRVYSYDGTIIDRRKTEGDSVRLVRSGL